MKDKVAFLWNKSRPSAIFSKYIPRIFSISQESPEEIFARNKPRPESPQESPQNPFRESSLTISSDGVAWKYQRRGNFYSWQAVASWSLIRILNSKQCFPANRSAGKWKVCWRHQIALYIEENRSANDFWSDDGDQMINHNVLSAVFPGVRSTVSIESSEILLYISA